MKEYWKKQLSSSHIETYTNAIKEVNEHINAFVVCNTPSEIVAPQEQSNDSTQSSAALSNIPFAIKSNIAVQGHTVNCASALLEHFKSPITASAVQSIFNNGAKCVGFTNMDEFGMGSSTVHSIYGRTNNPWDLQRSPGGSSGGTAAAVSAGTVPFALGSDTGGSIRQPAMFCGAWGLKPSYGAVSRYGLVAYSSSLDVIGIIAEDPYWLDTVFSVMKVQERDAHDASSFYPKTVPSTEVKKIAAYIPKKEDITEQMYRTMQDAMKGYRNAGYEVEEIDLSIFEYAPAVYLTISTAEASANLARFDGIRYGNRGGFAENASSLVQNARNHGLGEEVKLRIITGGYVLQSGFQDQYYTKALSLRKHIRKTLVSILSHYDMLMLPVFPTQAFLFEDKNMNDFAQKIGDTYSVVANLSGLPAISCPTGLYDQLPSGIQMIGPYYSEKRLCKFAADTKHIFEHHRSAHAQAFFKRTSQQIQGEST